MAKPAADWREVLSERNKKFQRLSLEKQVEELEEYYAKYPPGHHRDKIKEQIDEQKNSLAPGQSGHG
jgi:hypothetical protein